MWLWLGVALVLGVVGVAVGLVALGGAQLRGNEAERQATDSQEVQW